MKQQFNLQVIVFFKVLCTSLSLSGYVIYNLLYLFGAQILGVTLVTCVIKNLNIKYLVTITQIGKDKNEKIICS